jgi:hypothetical protein
MKKFLLLSAVAMVGASAFAEEEPITKYDYNTIKAINVHPTDFDSANLPSSVWSVSDCANYWSDDNGLVLIGGKVGRDMVVSGLSLVDLGGEVGQVLCINGYESKFNDYVKANYNVDLNAPKMDSSIVRGAVNGWWQFNWLAKPADTPRSNSKSNSVPTDSYVHVKMVFNVFANEFDTNTCPTSVYIKDNQNNVHPASDDSADKIAVSGDEFIKYYDDDEDDPMLDDDDNFIWDPTKWMVYEFDTWCPANDGSTSYAPIYVKCGFGNGKSSIGQRTVLVKSVEFTKMDGKPTILNTRSRKIETLKVFEYSNNDNAAVSDLAVEDSNAPVEVYNLSGVRVNSDNLPAGLYIRRQGNKATKVVVK